jgi:hypothetical protein
VGGCHDSTSLRLHKNVRLGLPSTRHVPTGPADAHGETCPNRTAGNLVATSWKATFLISRLMWSVRQDLNLRHFCAQGRRRTRLAHGQMTGCPYRSRTCLDGVKNHCPADRPRDSETYGVLALDDADRLRASTGDSNPRLRTLVAAPGVEPGTFTFRACCAASCAMRHGNRGRSRTLNDKVGACRVTATLPDYERSAGQHPARITTLNLFRPQNNDVGGATSLRGTSAMRSDERSWPACCPAYRRLWWNDRESNPEPRQCHCRTLPVELSPHVVDRRGVEPRQQPCKGRPSP